MRYHMNTLQLYIIIALFVLTLRREDGGEDLEVFITLHVNVLHPESCISH